VIIPSQRFETTYWVHSSSVEKSKKEGRDGPRKFGLHVIQPNDAPAGQKTF